jgi:hypothetical protein
MGAAPGVSPHGPPPRRDPTGITPPDGSRAVSSSEEPTRRPSTGCLHLGTSSEVSSEGAHREPSRAGSSEPSLEDPSQGSAGHHLAGATPLPGLLGAPVAGGAPGCLPDRFLLGGFVPGVSRRRVLESFSSEEPSILPSTRSLHVSSFPEEPSWRAAHRGFPQVSPESFGSDLRRASTRPFPRGRPSLAAALRSLYFGMTFRREYPSSSSEDVQGAPLLESTSSLAPRSRT